jgi:hypothetical protein
MAYGRKKPLEEDGGRAAGDENDAPAAAAVADDVEARLDDDKAAVAAVATAAACPAVAPDVVSDDAGIGMVGREIEDEEDEDEDAEEDEDVLPDDARPFETTAEKEKVSQFADTFLPPNYTPRC